MLIGAQPSTVSAKSCLTKRSSLTHSLLRLPFDKRLMASRRHNCRSSILQRTANSVLFYCLSQGVHPRNANIALRASGYRTRVQTGHHQKIVESLELTLKSDPKLIQKLKVFSKKRNATSYDAAGNISEQELEQAIKVAEELQHSVSAWLRQNHPALLSAHSWMGELR